LRQLSPVKLKLVKVALSRQLTIDLEITILGPWQVLNSSKFFTNPCDNNKLPNDYSCDEIEDSTACNKK
jgi:hypothetical protein